MTATSDGIMIQVHPTRFHDWELDNLAVWAEEHLIPHAPQLAVWLLEFATAEIQRRQSDEPLEPQMPMVRAGEWTAGDVAAALGPLACAVVTVEDAPNIRELSRALFAVLVGMVTKALEVYVPGGVLFLGSADTDAAASEVR